jgi:hypothetical protein
MHDQVASRSITWKTVVDTIDRLGFRGTLWESWTGRHGRPLEAMAVSVASVARGLWQEGGEEEVCLCRWCLYPVVEA